MVSRMYRLVKAKIARARDKGKQRKSSEAWREISLQGRYIPIDIRRSRAVVKRKGMGND